MTLSACAHRERFAGTAVPVSPPRGMQVVLAKEGIGHHLMLVLQTRYICCRAFFEVHFLLLFMASLDPILSLVSYAKLRFLPLLPWSLPQSPLIHCQGSTVAGQANLGAERMCQHGTRSIKLASRELLAPGRAPVAARFQLAVTVSVRPRTSLVTVPDTAVQEKCSREVWWLLCQG